MNSFWADVVIGWCIFIGVIATGGIVGAMIFVPEARYGVGIFVLSVALVAGVRMITGPWVEEVD